MDRRRWLPNSRHWTRATADVPRSVPAASTPDWFELDVTHTGEGVPGPTLRVGFYGVFEEQLKALASFYSASSFYFK